MNKRRVFIMKQLLKGTEYTFRKFLNLVLTRVRGTK